MCASARGPAAARANVGRSRRIGGVLVLVARVADAWLGTWSRAEAISAYPIDPVRLPAQVAELLREKVA